MVIYSDTVEPLSEIHSIDIPVSASIFHKVDIAGFSLHAWIREQPEEYKKAVGELCALLDGAEGSALLKNMKKFKHEDYKKALDEAHSGELVVLSM